MVELDYQDIAALIEVIVEESPASVPIVTVNQLMDYLEENFDKSFRIIAREVK